MEVDIVTFVVKGNVQLTILPDRQEQVHLGYIVVALFRVFDFKLSGIHLTKIIIKIWVIDWQYVIDVSVCQVELRCFFSSWNQRLYAFLFVRVQKRKFDLRSGYWEAKVQDEDKTMVVFFVIVLSYASLSLSI